MKVDQNKELADQLESAQCEIIQIKELKENAESEVLRLHAQLKES